MPRRVRQVEGASEDPVNEHQHPKWLSPVERPGPRPIPSAKPTGVTRTVHTIVLYQGSDWPGVR